MKVSEQLGWADLTARKRVDFASRFAKYKLLFGTGLRVLALLGWATREKGPPLSIFLHPLPAQKTEDSRTPKTNSRIIGLDFGSLRESGWANYTRTLRSVRAPKFSRMTRPYRFETECTLKNCTLRVAHCTSFPRLTGFDDRKTDYIRVCAVIVT